MLTNQKELEILFRGVVTGKKLWEGKRDFDGTSIKSELSYNVTSPISINEDNRRGSYFEFSIALSVDNNDESSKYYIRIEYSHLKEIINNSECDSQTFENSILTLASCINKCFDLFLRSISNTQEAKIDTVYFDAEDTVDIRLNSIEFLK